MQGDVFFLASTQEEQYAKIMEYPFSMKNFLKSVREIADKYGKKLMISLDGYDPKPDQLINKKKAR
jgi:hypothetical protein